MGKAEKDVLKKELYQVCGCATSGGSTWGCQLDANHKYHYMRHRLLLERQRKEVASREAPAPKIKLRYLPGYYARQIPGMLRLTPLSPENPNTLVVVVMPG